MINKKGKFKFYAVGQGLFYAGQVFFENRVFNFVYDIGTDSSGRPFLAQAMERYQDEFLGDHKLIDILFISHFNYEHYSGLEQLLAAGITIKNVVLPKIATQEISEKLWSITDRIENNKNINPDHPYDIVPELEANKIFVDGKTDVNKELKLVIPTADGQPIWLFDVFVADTFNRQSTRPAGQIQVKNAYERKLKLWIRALKVRFNVESDEDLEQFVLNQIRSGNVTSVVRKLKNEMTKVKINTSDQMKLYGINLLHGPTFSDWKSQSMLMGNEAKQFIVENQLQMLTGDSGLRDDSRSGGNIFYYSSLFEWQKHYQKYFDENQIGILQVPHHGSRNNYSDVFTKIPVRVLSFGSHNLYYHPHMQVRQKLNISTNPETIYNTPSWRMGSVRAMVNVILNEYTDDFEIQIR